MLFATSKHSFVFLNILLNKRNRATSNHSAASTENGFIKASYSSSHSAIKIDKNLSMKIVSRQIKNYEPIYKHLETYFFAIFI